MLKTVDLSPRFFRDGIRSCFDAGAFAGGDAFRLALVETQAFAVYVQKTVEVNAKHGVGNG